MNFIFGNRTIFWDIPKWNRWQTNWDGENIYLYLSILNSEIAVIAAPDLVSVSFSFWLAPPTVTKHIPLPLPLPLSLPPFMFFSDVWFSSSLFSANLFLCWVCRPQLLNICLTSGLSLFAPTPTVSNSSTSCKQCCLWKVHKCFFFWSHTRMHHCCPFF